MSLLFAMFSFSLTMSISPGPVNMVILSSGATYGMRKTFGFVSGATMGFTLLLLCIGLGLANVLNSYPNFLNYLALFGALFIVYLGYLIASAMPSMEIKEQSQPTFMQGVLLQWLNPKAWIACMVGASLFTVANNKIVFLVFVLIYFVVCYISLTAWSLIGEQAKKLINCSSTLRRFNQSMGGLLMLTACFLLYSQFNVSI